MPDREKVIKGLECCSAMSGDECRRCPYSSDCRDEILPVGMLHLANDALELLKGQEPRVLTLEDVKAFDWDYCYLEEERLPGKGYRAVCGDYALTCITWPCVTSMRIQHGDESYGRKWRCWSAKPTDEQRKAVKWDE